MSKVLLIIGLILTAGVTLPILLFITIASIYGDWINRPDAPPPTKDEWRIM